MVARTHLDITLYVRGLSCCILHFFISMTHSTAETGLERDADLHLVIAYMNCIPLMM